MWENIPRFRSSHRKVVNINFLTLIGANSLVQPHIDVQKVKNNKKKKKKGHSRISLQFGLFPKVIIFSTKKWLLPCTLFFPL